MKDEVQKARPDPWKPITLEDAAEKPVRFEHRGDLRKFMRERGWSSSALL